MNLTTEQIALNNHIAKANAEFEAKCIAEGATMWCVSALNANDLAEYGVYNVEQYKEWQAENEQQEAIKDARKNW